MNKLIPGKFDTDKDDKYLKTYEEVFQKYENKPIDLLELGVYHGGSLLLWSNHFQKGKIIGVDIDDIQIELPSNVIFKIGDQRDKDFLERITKEHTKNGFDVIIDDASHLGNFTEASFLICFNNLLKSKGIYVI
jgi:cephalosporin hydroxylase